MDVANSVHSATPVVPNDVTALAENQLRMILKQSLKMCDELVSLKNGDAYMNGHISTLGTKACQHVLLLAGRTWSAIRGLEDEEDIRRRIVTIMITVLGQVTGDTLRQCRGALVAWSVRTGQEFHLNTMSRSRSMSEEGDSHRLFVASEKIQWTVPYPKYSALVQDYTRALGESSTARDGDEYLHEELSAAQSEAMRTILAWKPARGCGGGTVWPKMLQDNVSPCVELHGDRRSAPPLSRPVMSHDSASHTSCGCKL